MIPNHNLPARYNIYIQMARLKRNSPIRRWREANLKPKSANVSALFQAYEQSHRHSLGDHLVALHLFGTLNLNTEERERAMQLLLESLQWPRSEKISFLCILTVLGIAGLIWLAIFAGFITLITTDVDTMVAQLFALLPLSALSAFLYFCIRNVFDRQAIQRAAVTSLASVGTPACVLFLWKHVSEDGVASGEALQALKVLLPLITAEWSIYLQEGTEGALVELAKSIKSTDVSIALAALNALGEVGGGDAVKPVENLAARSRSKQVRTLAAAILPRLIARRELQTAAATLLRPSLNNRTEHLVRPAYERAPDTDHLLRAAHGEGSVSFEAGKEQRT